MIDVTSDKFKGAEDLILGDPFGHIDMAAELKMASPGRYAALEERARDVLKGSSHTTWKSGVNGVAKDMARRSKEAKVDERRADRIANAAGVINYAQGRGLPVFTTGSNTDLAGALVKYLQDKSAIFGEDGEPLAPGEPIALENDTLYTYSHETGLWSPVHEAKCSNIIQSWDGAPIIPEDKGIKDQILKVNNVDTAIRLAKSKPFEWGRHEGWLSDAPKGVAFADTFAKVDETDDVLDITFVDHSPENRARTGFDFACDVRIPPDCPRFMAYLQDIWGGSDDFEERCALLQEFTGVALLGMSPRYKKALILYGHKGTGKSTFLQLIRGIMPSGSLSEVSPLDWSDDNKVAGLDGSLLNTIFELSSGHLKNQERVKEVIDGERIQVREVYTKQSTIVPRGAHLFASNRLFKAPGADPSFWDRFLVLDLFKNRSFRDTDAEVKNLAGIILATEREGLVKWALEGARRVFAQDGYTIPGCCKATMDEWKIEADPVASFLADVEAVVKVNEQPIKGADTDLLGAGPDYAPIRSKLYPAFCEWSKRLGFSSMSEREFSKRLMDQGVHKRKMKGINHYAVALAPATPTRW